MGNINQNADLIANNQNSNPSEKEPSLSKEFEKKIQLIFSQQSKTLRDDLKAIFTKHSKQLMINLSTQSKYFENKLITALVTQYNLVSKNLIIN